MKAVVLHHQEQVELVILVTTKYSVANCISKWKTRVKCSTDKITSTIIGTTETKLMFPNQITMIKLTIIDFSSKTKNDKIGK